MGPDLSFVLGLPDITYLTDQLRQKLMNLKLQYLIRYTVESQVCSSFSLALY